MQDVTLTVKMPPQLIAVVQAIAHDDRRSIEDEIVVLTLNAAEKEWERRFGCGEVAPDGDHKDKEPT